MGVRGLTTYIYFNQDTFLKHYLLHDCNLVIDGHSLCAQLYGSLNIFSAFGGDYDKFAAYTRSFFKNLRKCNITPYVIFDGSYEPKKLKTVYSRLRSKIFGASKLDPVTQSSLQIFPLLLRDVFKEVLTDMKIPFTVCEFEADNEIAAMARYLNCPVLSYDSDFFIFNVLYIPFKTLEHKPNSIDNNGNRVYALKCKIYLADGFGGVQNDMLPLLATLLGNDYVDKKVFRKFFSQLKLPKSKNKKNEQQRSIQALFNWMENETLESAVSKVLGRLKKNQKHKVHAKIKKSIDSYNNRYCRSLKYFNITYGDIPQPPSQSTNNIIDDSDGDDDDSDESSDDSDDSSENDSPSSVTEEIADNDLISTIPVWFADGVRNNTIPFPYQELYTLHLYFCSPQAEDYSDEDSSLCTLSILRYAFDILTDFSHEYFTYVSREKNCSYRRLLVGQEYAVPRPLEVPFCDLSSDQLKSYFKNFLNVKLPSLDITTVEMLPSNLQLFFIAIVWWVTTCKVTLAYIHSLFISYLMLEVIDEKTGMFRGHYQLNNKYSKKLEELRKGPFSKSIMDSNLFFNKNKVLYEDCLLAASVLLKHFEIDPTIRKKPKSYDVKKIHSFAQFQCCLLQFNSLNILCGSPFESTKYSKSYNGTFVYNLALKLENQSDPDQFIQQYLKGATTVLMYYSSLCQIYTKLADAMSLSTKPPKERRRRRGKNVSCEDEELHFIIKGFESEVVI